MYKWTLSTTWGYTISISQTWGYTSLHLLSVLQWQPGKNNKPLHQHLSEHARIFCLTMVIMGSRDWHRLTYELLRKWWSCATTGPGSKDTQKRGWLLFCIGLTTLVDSKQNATGKWTSYWRLSLVIRLITTNYRPTLFLVPVSVHVHVCGGKTEILEMCAQTTIAHSEHPSTQHPRGLPTFHFQPWRTPMLTPYGNQTIIEPW